MKHTAIILAMLAIGCCSEQPYEASDCVTETNGAIGATDETQCAWFGSSEETGTIEILYPRTGTECPISCGWRGRCAPYTPDLCFPCPPGVTLEVPLGEGFTTVVCPED